MHHAPRSRPGVKPLFIGLCAVALAVMGLARSALATVVVIHPLDEMTARSDVVVHARVGAQQVVRDKGRLITLTEIEVIEGFKGARAGDILTIYQVGGDLDGEHQWISGMQRYMPGEEMVLFAVRFGDKIVSYGVGVGKFKIERDADGTRVVEDIHDVVAYTRDPDGAPSMQQPRPRERPSLDGFKTEIRDYVAHPIQLAKPKAPLRHGLRKLPGPADLRPMKPLKPGTTPSTHGEGR